MSYIIAMGFKVNCVPVLDKMPCCCCSCDLKLATCILGWLGLVSLQFALMQEFFVCPHCQEERLVSTFIPRRTMRKLLTMISVTKSFCAKSTKINTYFFVPSLLTYEKILFTILSNYFHGIQHLLK